MEQGRGKVGMWAQKALQLEVMGPWLKAVQTGRSIGNGSGDCSCEGRRSSMLSPCTHTSCNYVMDVLTNLIVVIIL